MARKIFLAGLALVGVAVLTLAGVREHREEVSARAERMISPVRRRLSPASKYAYVDAAPATLHL